MGYENIALSKAGGIATIKFTRPATLNSLTIPVYQELARATRELAADDEVRVLVITGEGRGFCSGGDVNEIIGKLISMDTGGLLAFTHLTGSVTSGLLGLGKPSIASINGIAAGAGAVIASACDIRIAAESARFAFLFRQVGLAGADMGSAYLLPRLVGLGKASELLMTGGIIGAREAERIGLVNTVVPDDQLQKVTRDMAENLASGPPIAMRVTKELLQRELNMDPEAAIELEAVSQALCMATPDFKEGYQAFQERRPPVFTGR